MGTIPGSNSPARGTFWDCEVDQPTQVSWLEPLAVRIYVNTAISGDQGVWPLQWFQRLYPGPFKRVLSVGCGTGPLERSLMRGIRSRAVHHEVASDFPLPPPTAP
jgi:hypothetical protein